MIGIIQLPEPIYCFSLKTFELGVSDLIFSFRWDIKSLSLRVQYF